MVIQRNVYNMLDFKSWMVKLYLDYNDSYIFCLCLVLEFENEYREIGRVYL